MQKPIVVQGDLTQELQKEFASQRVLGVDCEMMGLDPNRDRLCVVQIAAEKGSCVLVQIKEKEGAPKLKAILENQAITKIFHFARMDIFFLYSRIHIDVQNIYCTKIASRVVRTYTDRHGLKELVREFTGENLDKSNQSSDWGAPELTKDQIHYAAGDVIYLFELKRNLDKMIDREQRRDLFEKLIHFLPTQRQLDCLGYQYIFEHRSKP